MVETAKQTPIQQFYANKSVFITGGTGFLGTILIEKLLRSCPDVSTLYILVRGKKGKTPQTRIDELMDLLIFDRLRKERPKFWKKVVGIEGDCSLPGLGIDLRVKKMLINEVSIVFHMAATVRFAEKLKTAAAINVRGPEEVTKLARQMPHLKSLIHVSTAYSHAPNDVIEEKLYPSPVDGEKFILLTETLSENILNDITPKILAPWPNSYSYTKAIAEDVVRREGQNMPVGVFRPSIIVSTYLEPIEGWINNLYGPAGISVNVSVESGILRALHANGTVNANVVPVDMCANGLIAMAWDVANNNENSKFDIPVYHYESSNDRPLNWNRFTQFAFKHCTVVPTIKAIWYMCFNLYSNVWLYYLAVLLLHYVPAILVDDAMLCIRKRPRMLEIYRKTHKFTDALSYFTTREWIFKSERVSKMIGRMTEDDQKLFFCDLKKLDWDLFFENYFIGVRTYLLQDPMDTLEKARVKWRRLYYLHFLVKATTVYAVLRLLWWILTVIIDF